MTLTDGAIEAWQRAYLKPSPNPRKRHRRAESGGGVCGQQCEARLGRVCQGWGQAVSPDVLSRVVYYITEYFIFWLQRASYQGLKPDSAGQSADK